MMNGERLLRRMHELGTLIATLDGVLYTLEVLGGLDDSFENPPLFLVAQGESLRGDFARFVFNRKSFLEATSLPNGGVLMADEYGTQLTLSVSDVLPEIKAA